MNKKNGNASVYIIIVIVILAICAMIFGGDNTNDDLTSTPDSFNNSMQEGSNAIKNTIEIADANAKELYDRVTKGITLDGKLIEVPANYMK